MALRVRVCNLAEVVDGQLNAFAVPGVTWPVIVTRIEGALAAVPGVCPHQDVGLSDAELRGHQIICRGHAYAFDVRTGRCEHDPRLALRRYPITLIGGELWVDLTGTAG
jgi:nitrite reductase/ring-hydroxylating ferredoxin subunit